ncbi:MAG: hypothetical protein EXR83_03545 [Gammaproteobacteria bacterium]|nr:hypothetical protein [Gammaproteobacteria bacterium]
MPVHCPLELLEEPLDLSFEAIRNARLAVFFALGTLDSTRPSLSFVATLGASQAGAAQPLLAVTLDPFGQRVQQTGWFSVGEVWNPLQVFQPLVARVGEASPALVLLGEMVSVEQRSEVAASLFAHFGHAPAQARELAGQALSAAHVWPTLNALLQAWQTASEVSVLPVVLPVEALQTFLTDTLVASVWWPEPPSDHAPPAAAWSPASAQEVRQRLHGGAWRDLAGDELLNVLRHCLMLYGREVNAHDIAPLAALYGYAVPLTSADQRTQLVLELAGYVQDASVHAVVLLPIVVKDPVAQVVTAATIDFIAHSPWLENGASHALSELGELLKHGGIANPGAAFGALVAMGEQRFWPQQDALRVLLTPDQIAVAAQVHTALLRHGAVAYWLRWAQAQVAVGGEVFRHLCTALALARRRDQSGQVIDTERDLPVTGNPQPLRIKQVWSLEEYAAYLAPSLRDLALREDRTAWLLEVLQAWQITPQTPASKFIN